MKMFGLIELCRARKAVAALEFALVALPLFMLVLGTIEFGRLLWTQQALQSAATAGARCVGILASSCASGGAFSASNSRSYIENVAGGWGVSVTDADITTLTTTSTDTECSGLAEVQINYTFTTAVPQLLTMLSGNALTGHACFPNQS